MSSQRNFIIVIAGLLMVFLGVMVVALKVFVPPKNIRLSEGPPIEINDIKKLFPQSLGSEIYAKVNNPIEDKVPEVNPAANTNPIEDVYKNPFE